MWARPAAGLMPYVAQYVGYRQAGVEPAIHRGLPSPELTLIFTLDEPLEMAAHPDPGQLPGSFDTLVGGLHVTPALITHEGRQSGIQLGLSPLGARTLLGPPAGELAGIDLDAADLLGSLAGEIQERVRAEDSWPARFAVLDQMLLARIAASDTVRPVGDEVSYAWRTLMRSGGRVSIADLAAATGWSDRHLRGRFRIETGLTPKAAARVIRFTRARLLLQRRVSARQPPALAGLAADCGYFDQAHLAREFRDLAGCPPTQWLAQECRNIQAVPDGQVTGSQS